MASCPSQGCCLSMARLHVSGKSKAWLLVSGYLSKLLVNGKLPKARLLVQVEASDLVGLADHWIGFGWIGYGWTGFCRFIALDWIGSIGLEAPGAPVVIPH